MTWEELLAAVKDLGGTWRKLPRFKRDSPEELEALTDVGIEARKQGEAKGIKGKELEKAVRSAIAAATPGIRAQSTYEIELPDDNRILKSVGSFASEDDLERYLESYTSLETQRRRARATKKQDEAAVKEKEKAEKAQEKATDIARRQGDVEAREQRRRQEAEAKAVPPEYANPVQQPPFAPPAGHRWQWDEPRKRWTPVEVPKPQRPRTLEEALTFGSEEEINRFLAARETLSLPTGFEQQQLDETMRQRLFQNQLSLRDQELQEQEAAMALARSPGDYALWWNLLSGQGTGTPSDFEAFQRSGVRAGLYPSEQPSMEGLGGAPSGAPQPGETREQVEAALRAFIAGGGTEGMSPPQLEMTNKAWTERYRRAQAESAAKAQAPAPALTAPSTATGVMTPEEQVRYEAFVDAGDEETADAILRQAQSRAALVNAPRYSAQNPQPGAMSLAQAQAAQGAGTLPQGTLFPGLQPRAGIGTVNKMTAVSPNWMQVLFARSPQRIQYLQDIQAGRPTGQRRTIPNITGQPFPSAQTLNRLTPSQQAGFFGQYGAGAVPREDLLNEFQRTTAGFPNMPRRFLFRPRAIQGG